MNEKVKNEIDKAYWYEQRQTLGNHNMKLKPYPEYKDSGIKWIGKIPKGWEVRKLKYNYDIIGKTNIPASEGNEEGGVPFFTSGESIKYTDKPIISGEYIIVGDGGIPNFKYYKGEFSYSDHCFLLKTNKESFSKFLYYFLIGNVEIFDILCFHGMGLRNLDQYKFNSFFSNLPSFSEQIPIANFLDKKTTKIDALIEKDKKLIGLLKEKRTALINHAVTKGLPVRASRPQTGLDPNVKMKDSGIEWIGEIPEGWEVYKLKYKTIINKKKLEDDINPNYVINYLDISNVDSSGNILAIEEQIFEDAPSRARRIPRSGDTILSTVRTYLKAIAYLENIPGNLIVSTGFAVLEPIKSINSKYLFYSTSSEVFIQNVIAYSKGVVYPAINPTELGQIPIIMPPLSEQITIVNFLDKATAKIDKTIKKIEQKIKLLEEYKKSLIHHTVTGKIDIREVKI